MEEVTEVGMSGKKTISGRDSGAGNAQVGTVGVRAAALGRSRWPSASGISRVSDAIVVN